MAKIMGLGGIFYQVQDPERTSRWYKEILGIGGEWGATFRGRPKPAKEGSGPTS